MDHSNIFNPYQNKPLDHEDQLTRALMILVKNSRTVEVAFIDMIIEEMINNRSKLIPNRFSQGDAGLTTIKMKLSSSIKDELTNVSGRLVPVIITDQRLFKSDKIQQKDKSEAYHVILHYKPNWIFVIGNRPEHKDTWYDKLNSALSESFEVEPKPVGLRWKNIITRISSLVENGYAIGAESYLVDDFLDYIENKFPELNLFARFELCKRNKHLLDRRCATIMDESHVHSTPAEYHRGLHYFVKYPDEAVNELALYSHIERDGKWDIRFAFYPGDTMIQARYLYSQLHIDNILRLPDAGWQIRPNFHFAFGSVNLVFTSVACSLKEYLEYWMIQVMDDNLRQVPREEWSEYFKQLSNAGMLSKRDEAQIDINLLRTTIDFINICPGIELVYRWQQNEAIDLDNKGIFLSSFVSKVNECIGTWK